MKLVSWISLVLTLVFASGLWIIHMDNPAVGLRFLGNSYDLLVVIASAWGLGILVVLPFIPGLWLRSRRRLRKACRDAAAAAAELRRFTTEHPEEELRIPARDVSQAAAGA